MNKFNKLRKFLIRQRGFFAWAIATMVLMAIALYLTLFAAQALAESFAEILAPAMRETALENECATMGYPESLMTLDRVMDTWNYYCIKFVDGTSVTVNLFDLREALPK